MISKATCLGEMGWGGEMGRVVGVEWWDGYGCGWGVSGESMGDIKERDGEGENGWETWSYTCELGLNLTNEVHVKLTLPGQFLAG